MIIMDNDEILKLKNHARYVMYGGIIVVVLLCTIYFRLKIFRSEVDIFVVISLGLLVMMVYWSLLSSAINTERIKMVNENVKEVRRISSRNEVKLDRILNEIFINKVLDKSES